MSVFDWISMLGGLALFLYGMNVMTAGLERISGGRMEAALEKMTDNVVKSILLGMVVTAAIQSSSATTVIVVGLVNAGLLKLRQAVGIIMGANIGTTITAHILSLSGLGGGGFFSYFKMSTIAPLLALVGILLFLAAKQDKHKNIGQMLLGLSILFFGMFAMEGAVSGLRDAPGFAEMFAKLSNPILGVLAGAIVTAVIQSSSASVGILQALASTGAITFASAFPIIMGQNIGTCITPVLSSIGASKGAKRTAFVHVAFNVVGTVLFLVIIYAVQTLIGFPFWTEAITKSGIANFHTVFNLTCTLAFAPFVRQFEKLAYLVIPVDGSEKVREDETALLDDRFLTSPGFAIQQAREVVERMASLSLENFKGAVELLHAFDKAKLQRLREQEDMVDRYQSQVDIYLLKIAQKTLTNAEKVLLSEVLQVVNEFERIADHADNICDNAQDMYKKNISFSESGMVELDLLCEAVEEILGYAVQGYTDRDGSLAERIDPLEEAIDIMVELLKIRHNERLQQNLCSLDSAFPFLNILTDMERISDHCSNVGVHVIFYSNPREVVDRHDYLQELRRERTGVYQNMTERYSEKYIEPLEKLDVLPV